MLTVAGFCGRLEVGRGRLHDAPSIGCPARQPDLCLALQLPDAVPGRIGLGVQHPEGATITQTRVACRTSCAQLSVPGWTEEACRSVCVSCGCAMCFGVPRGLGCLKFTLAVFKRRERWAWGVGVGPMLR